MKWKLALGSLLSLVFLYLAFRNARLEEVLAALRSARYELMIPTLFLTMLSFAIRAWRWRFLLASVQEIPFLPLFSATMIGFMGNNLLPARLGELLRVHAIGRSQRISRSSALGSIVLERMFDVLVLLSLFGLVLFSDRLPLEVQSWGLYLLAVSVPVVLFVVALRHRSRPILALVERISPQRFRPRTLHIARSFRDGLGILGHGRALFGAFILSILMWACLVGVVTLCFAALHLELPPDAGVVALVVMAVGTMIPSAPGFVGTLQYAGVLALLAYGVERSTALSFTLLFHASQWIPTTAVGLYFFLREHLSLRQISGISTPEGSPTETLEGKEAH